MKVLIADDEAEVLKGLKHIIDWHSLGFTICGEASSGSETLQKIQILKPDLVLLDIRMPKITGLEIIQRSRDFHYQGHFIILSGYSDFSYAQTAVRLNVDNYLVKPVDEEELAAAVIKVRTSILEQQKKDNAFLQYRESARNTILINLILGQADAFSYDLSDLHLIADEYMLVLYERYNQSVFQEFWNFADLLRVGNQDYSSFEYISHDNHEFILLKGSNAIKHFHHLLDHYNNGPEAGSPLDSLFLIYGRTVSYVDELKNSYMDTLRLLQRRFFCEERQHILSYHDLPGEDELCSISNQTLSKYPSCISGYIQSHNRSMLAETLMELEKTLYYSSDDVTALKHILIDLFLQVKQIVSQTYPTENIPFPGNSTILEFIMSRFYLYEIIQFFSEQFEMCVKAIGSQDSTDIMDDVIYYIRHNYAESLRLESIAPLFGYNSSYLGKIFTRKVGENFNAYLDRVRIENAQRLLLENHYKTYEVSEKVGYKNADYFYKKFRKYTGMTPSEYKKSTPAE